MKTILVTGGAGFIGSHTCLTLLENKFKIIIADSFQNSSPLALEKVKFLLEKKLVNIKNKLRIYKNIENLNFIEQIFKDVYLNEKIDAVYTLQV